MVPILSSPPLPQDPRPSLPDIKISGTSWDEKEDNYWTVGNPEAFKQIVNQVKSQRDIAAFITPSNWDSLHVFYRRCVLKNLDLNGDGKKEEQLILLSYVIGVAEGEDPKTVSFLLRQDGQASDEEAVVDQMMMGSLFVVDMAQREGWQNPFDSFVVLRAPKKLEGQRDSVTYEAYNEQSNQCDKQTVPENGEALSSVRVQDLHKKMDQVVSYVMNKLDYLGAQLVMAENEEGKQAGKLEEEVKSALYSSLKLPLVALMNYVDHVSLDDLTPEVQSQLRTMSIWAKRQLDIGAMDASLKARQKERVTQGRALLGSPEKDLDKRKQKMQEALELYKGLIVERQVFAKSLGQSNYVKMKWKEFGYTPDDLNREADRIQAKYQARFKKFVGGLKAFKAQKEGKKIKEVQITHADLTQLFDESLKTRLREVSREHHISFDGQSFSLSPEQADQIARRFFKDLGIDLDLPPFYKIVPDLKSRDLKMKGYLAKNIDGGSLISLNFANDQFSLRELSGLLHEYGHAIHHILAAQASGKSRTRGIAVAAEPFMEGVGKMLNRIVYSKGFMQTYLKDVDGFKEPVIQDVLADTYQDQFAAVAILGINDALIEAELYDIVSSHPEKNIAQDLKRLIDKHYRGLLGIDWANLVNVLPLAFHFPGYRGNYALGYEWAGKSLSDVLDVFVDEKGNDKKTVDADELKEAGKQLRTLFAKLDYDYDLKKSFQVKE